MPTIIDSLLVTLGLDSKKFDQGKARVDKGLKDTGKEADDTGKKLQGAGDSGAKGFDTATAGLTKFLAKLGGLYAIKKFVVDTVQTNAELFRFSRNLGESANKISAWSNAIEITGGDAKAFQGTLSMLSRSQTELQMTGQSGLLPYFSRFNVAMMDANGNARKGTDILLDFADRMKGMDRTTAFNTLQAMGIDPGTANAMLEGRAALERLTQAQKEHGALTDKQAQSAESTRRSMTEAEIATKAVKNELSDSLNPTLKAALDLFNQLDKATNGWSTAIIGLAGALGTLRLGLGAVGPSVAAAGGTGAATAGAGAAGGLLARLLGFLRLGVGGGALLYSEGLNKGEDEELARRRGMPAYISPTGGTGTSLPATGAGAGRGSQGMGDKTAKLAALERQYGLPAGLLDSVWNAESGRGRNTTSPAGAQGDFQFMPKTAKEYGVTNPYNFDEAADGAARYYRKLLDQYGGDVGKAAAAYNWGMGNMDRKGFGSAPAETRDYVNKVMNGIPGASQAASGASGAGAGRGVSQNTMSIGEIKVYTQATDAKGIVRDMGPAIDAQYPSQANWGTN